MMKHNENHIEQFAHLLYCSTISEWRNYLFKLTNYFNYEKILLAILPVHNTQPELKFTFFESSYSSAWISKYNKEKLGYIDPIVTHCASKSTPLIWTPDVFADRKQKEMYEEACKYGIRSGVTLPLHGVKGELGVLCFVSDVKSDYRFQRDASSNIPELSTLRDFVMESSKLFIGRSFQKTDIHITRRELECLKWCAAGKSSWEIGGILNCSEATVNFHFKNIRIKLKATSRHQALAKAICLGLINL